MGVNFSFGMKRAHAGAAQGICGSSDELIAAGNGFWSQPGGGIDSEGDGSGVCTGVIYNGSEIRIALAELPLK